ncbi:MAG: hypothetical protein JF609_01075 [Verrucomicrobia bacterium]|nr:hypothetical protein [Verrucomicrobiota bacterium]
MISCHYFVTRDEYRRERRRFSIELALAINDVCEQWKNNIGDGLLNSILPAQIAEFMDSVTKIDSYTESVFGSYKRFILELILAVDDLWHTDNLDRWILEFGFSGDGSDYENDIPTPRSYEKIRRLIKGRTGQGYEEKTISKRAERLKLT